MHLPAMMGCRNVSRCYKRLNTIDEGTYGVVHRAVNKETGDVVALKKIKMEHGQHGGFPITSLREINVLLAIKHPNIVILHEIVTGKKSSEIFMVMEYMEHDLKMLMKSMQQVFRQSEVKCLLQQLLEATAAMHENWILHRDLKTSNLLLNNKGILKVCDFGLARRYGSPIGKDYTPVVVTQWYRAPELLLGAKDYTTAIDVWSVGCIFAEMLTGEALMGAKPGDLNQIEMMFKILGTPDDKIWPGYSELPQTKKWRITSKYKSKLREKYPKSSYTGGTYLSDLGYDLMMKMLAYNPDDRISARDALSHPYFTERPRPQDPALMPTFPSLNEGSRKIRNKLKHGTGMQHQENIKKLVKNKGESSGGFFVS